MFRAFIERDLNLEEWQKQMRWFSRTFCWGISSLLPEYWAVSMSWLSQMSLQIHLLIKKNKSYKGWGKMPGHMDVKIILQNFFIFPLYFKIPLYHFFSLIIWKHNCWTTEKEKKGNQYWPRKVWSVHFYFYCAEHWSTQTRSLSRILSLWIRFPNK